MYCGICGKDLMQCTCPDLADRMRTATDSRFVSTRWCARCDKHYAHCTCPIPLWGMRNAGQIGPLPEKDQAQFLAAGAEVVR